MRGSPRQPVSSIARYRPISCTAKRPAWGDQAYRGQPAVIRQHAPKGQDFINRRYRHHGMVNESERAKNRTKSKVRAKSLPSRKRGRAPDRGHQADLRLPQGALSRAQKERPPPARHQCARQSVHGTPAPVAPCGVICRTWSPIVAGYRADPPIKNDTAIPYCRLLRSRMTGFISSLLRPSLTRLFPELPISEC